MKFLLLTLAAMAIAAPACAQLSGFNSSSGSGQSFNANPNQDEGIGVNAGQNAFYSITNRMNGVSMIQVAKLSLINGGQYWQVYYNPGYDAFATAAAADRDSNLFVVGTVRQQGFTRQVLVLKYAPTGGMFWDYVYPTQANAVPTAAATDQDGNLFVAASVTVPGGTELDLLKISTSRGLLAINRYAQGRTNYGDSMVVDPNGNVEMLVHSTFGDASSGAYQTQRVLFAGNGAGWRPL